MVTELPRVAVCTVILKRQLPYARVLARSLARVHPQWPICVLLADRVDDYFSPADEPFTLVTLAELDYPDLASLAFRTTDATFSAALPPLLLRHLYTAGNTDRLIYFDAESLVLRPLTPLLDWLAEYAVLVTPQPGLVGLGQGPAIAPFLDAWQAATEAATWHADAAAGIADWGPLVDLAASLDGAVVADAPGLHLGYWNLPGRQIDLGADPRVDGQPLLCMHASGFNPDRPYHVSHDAPGLTLDQIGLAAILFDQYARWLAEADYAEAHDWPYAFDHFENGVPIPALARQLYRQQREAVGQWGNPFQTDHPASFYEWLNASAYPDEADGGLTHFWDAAHRTYVDLQTVFPAPLGAHREEFRRWTVTDGRQQLNISQRFIVHLPHLATSRPARDTSLPWGVNLIGHFGSEKGVGEGVRALHRALQATDCPHSLNNYQDVGSYNVEPLDLDFNTTMPYAVNLWHIGVDTAPSVLGQLKSSLAGHLNIAFWYWELPEFPLEWRDRFLAFDEVWTASTFNQAAFERVSPIPVRLLPCAIDPSPVAVVPELGLGWSPDTYTFLFAFDFHSIFERKNPLGLIKAFKRAFGPQDKVGLIIKTLRSDVAPTAAAALRAASQDPRIHLVDMVMTRAQMTGLIQQSDCYASLHRAEGFGLPLAEAMGLAKPVIATGYSGNLDFMSGDDSLLVEHRLIPLRDNYGPYRRGAVWAEPDIDHAVHLLRWVVANRDAAQALGERGRQAVLARLSPAVVGPQLQAHIQRLQG